MTNQFPSKEYAQLLRYYQANISISASTARRMGPPGTITAARNFLVRLHLERFHNNSKDDFYRELSSATNELTRRLPLGARNWGSARKFINIYLRGCVYNKYLSSLYKLDVVEPWLEVPLDSQVAKHLKRIAGRGQLPRWPGVIHLTPADSELFQDFATKLALVDGVHRVHLDLKFWRQVAEG